MLELFWCSNGWTAAAVHKLATSGLVREWDGVMGQASPQDARPLHCLLLQYPQLQRQKKILGKPQRNSFVMVVTSPLTLAEHDLAGAELQSSSRKHRSKNVSKRNNLCWVCLPSPAWILSNFTL